jgi:uncharacterized protein YydD (DUF2326 family)
MKLSKVYSNNTKFKPVVFNAGFNVIFGDVEKGKDLDKKTGEHNIGKTSLIYLIDFLLLKTVNKKTFFAKNKEVLSDWIFFLEIELNDGRYLTIRRAVNPNTKISFKEHFSRNQDFTHEPSWDYEDLSINATNDDDNPKYILENEYLKFDVVNDYGFRSFLSYLLRTQNDYQDVFKLNKFKGKDVAWKPLLFKLLGFDPKIIVKKYDLDEELKDEKKILKSVNSKLDTGSENAIKLAIEAKTTEKNELQSKIDAFDFYQKEQGINFELVTQIETKIAELNKKEYVLNHNIEKIKLSLDNSKKQTLQVDEIEQLYSEAGVYFPKQLVKEYKDVVEFSQQITKERYKYLQAELKEANDELQEVRTELKALNNKRSSALAILKEKDTFIKYRQYQADLVQIENEIFSYKQKLEGSQLVANYSESIDKLTQKIKSATEDIKKEITHDSADYLEIRKLFQFIYKEIFEYTAILIIEVNQSGNIEFDTSVLNQSQDLTSKADGYTSTKILCLSFVLSILIYYSNKSFYRFAYFDGLIESWGDGHKLKFFELIRHYCETKNIQLAISMIKSDLPSGFDFKNGEVIRTLSRKDELFGFEF